MGGRLATAWAATRRPGVRVAVRLVVASAVSYGVASAILRMPAPAAPLVPLIVFRTTDPWTIWRSLFGRLVGVLIGVALAIGILAVSKPTWWWVAIVVAIAGLAQAIPRLGAWLVGNWQIAISAVIIFGVGPGPYGYERLLETLIGAGVTIIVAAVLWPPDPVGELQQRADRMAGDVEADIRQAAGLIGLAGDAARSVERGVLRHLIASQALAAELARARRSLRVSTYRWRRRTEALDQLERRIEQLSGLYEVVHTLLHALVLLDVDARHAAPQGADRDAYVTAIDAVASAIRTPSLDLALRVEQTLGPRATAPDPWAQVFAVGLTELARELTPPSTVPAAPLLRPLS